MDVLELRMKSMNMQHGYDYGYGGQHLTELDVQFAVLGPLTTEGLQALQDYFVRGVMIPVPPSITAMMNPQPTVHPNCACDVGSEREPEPKAGYLRLKFKNHVGFDFEDVTGVHEDPLKHSIWVTFLGGREVEVYEEELADLVEIQSDIIDVGRFQK